MTPLISISDLTHQSWQFFTAHWKELAKRASLIILLLLAYVLLGAPAIAAGYYKSYVVILVLFILGVFVAMNHLYLFILKADHPTPPATLSSRAIDLLPAALFVALLTGLSIVLGTILFVIPGIWLSLALGFSHFSLLEDDAHGTKALRASYDLVKGRWWATFWRMFVPNLIVIAITGMINFCIWLVIGLLVGGSILALFAGTGSMMGAQTQNIAGGAIGIILMVLMLIVGFVSQVVLLFVSFCIPSIINVKLFHALKNSRS